MVDDCSSQKGNVKRLSNDTNGPDIGPDDGISSLDVDHDEQLEHGFEIRSPSKLLTPSGVDDQHCIPIKTFQQSVGYAGFAGTVEGYGAFDGEFHQPN